MLVKWHIKVIGGADYRGACRRQAYIAHVWPILTRHVVIPMRYIWTKKEDKMSGTVTEGLRCRSGAPIMPLERLSALLKADWT